MALDYLGVSIHIRSLRCEVDFKTSRGSWGVIQNQTEAGDHTVTLSTICNQ